MRHCLKFLLVFFGLELGIGRGGLATSYTFSMIDFPGSVATIPYGINDNGQIVGVHAGAGGETRGFLFNGSDYNTIDFAGASVISAYDINNAGQIVGTYDGRGFLLDGTNRTTIVFPGASNSDLFGINDAGVVSGSYFDSSGSTPQHFMMRAPPAFLI